MICRVMNNPAHIDCILPKYSPGDSLTGKMRHIKEDYQVTIKAVAELSLTCGRISLAGNF